jgi:hypothetical protein
MPETLDFVWAHCVRPHKIVEIPHFLPAIKGFTLILMLLWEE